MRAHIFRFFLDPYDFASVRMLVNGRRNLRTQQRVKLIEKNNRGAGVFAAAAFGAQLVSKLTADDQNALGILHFAIGHNRQKSRLCEIIDAGRSVWMTQHTFRREDDQRLAPRTPDLTPQEVKVLCSRRRLADLHVFFASELQETLDACAGML